MVVTGGSAWVRGAAAPTGVAVGAAATGDVGTEVSGGVGAGLLDVVGRVKRLREVVVVALRSFRWCGRTRTVTRLVCARAGERAGLRGRRELRLRLGLRRRRRGDRLHALVPDTGHRAGHDDGRRLEHEIGAHGRAAGCNGASTRSAEERGERPRQRDRGEDADGAPVKLEPAPRAEEQCLDRADGDAEDAGDLLVAPAFELAHHERRALVEREPGERLEHFVEVRALVLERGGLGSLLERDLARPAARLAPAHAADVVRDRDQPVVRLLRALASLVRAVGVEESGLGGVFGVSGVRQQGERVLVDLARVLLVELLEGRLHPSRATKRSQLPQRLPWSRAGGPRGMPPCCSNG